jgi:methionine aminotransferase
MRLCPAQPALRKSIADVVLKTYQREIDFETEITITAGGTEALFSAIAAFVKQGVEVIVFDPAYDSYNPSIRLNGGMPIHIKLKPPHFGIDWEEVKSKITIREHG